MADVTPQPAAGPVLVLNGSNRTGSFNRILGELVVDGLGRRGVDAELVDLQSYELPLFDADLLASEGPLPPAHELQARLAAAPGVVIVSPEYNGAMTPLLKNSVDWVSRVDMATFFTKRMAVLTATPGRLGGPNGRDLTQRWFTSIGAEVFDPTFGLPNVRDVLVDSRLADEQTAELDAYLDAFVSWLTRPPAT